MITVTKPFLPPKDEYIKYIDGIYKREFLTNQGPLLKELEIKLSNYLGVENFHYVTNGTIALQLALKALKIENCEVITTPFSYVATTSAILWQHCKPVFVDIEPDNFTINPEKIEKKITKNTKAILAVHVFGYACNIKAIEKIAKKHNLKVIYDGAHAFGAIYEGKFLLNYGDISTCSFHATKLYHTIEGGACIVKSKKISNKIELMKRFGHDGDEHKALGINAKQSEFNAAMGLANFKYLDEIINKRKIISELYDENLSSFQRPKAQNGLRYNYAYYPIVCKNHEQSQNIMDTLDKNNIKARRYFYPSLNTLKYLKEKNICKISQDISSRILCLPLYHTLDEKDAKNIANIIRAIL